MITHSEENFELFLSQLVETNATLSFWTDFEKIQSNVSNIEIKLNTLNYLIGKSDLRKAIRELWDVNPSVFDVLEILIACRKRDNKKVITTDTKVIALSSYLTTADGVIEFVEGTGLAQIFKDKCIKNLVDYVFGVEVGLDTNARKNRSGDLMEDTIEAIIKKAGLNYRKEVYSREWDEVMKALGNDKKRFDFIIETPSVTYLMEVNFYSGGGSKLNETARSFTEVGPKISSVPGFEFVWITDGIGWRSAKSMFKEAYFKIPHIYNLTTIGQFIKYIKENV